MAGMRSCLEYSRDVIKNKNLPVIAKLVSGVRYDLINCHLVHLMLIKLFM